MTRLARIVVPQVPHHVTQRGNRRQPVFFEQGVIMPPMSISSPPGAKACATAD